MTTFMKQCEDVTAAYEALQKALDAIKPQVGELPNNEILNIARTVTKARGAARPAPAPNPENITAAFEGKAQTNGVHKPNASSAVKDPEVIAKLPKTVRKVARAALKGFKDKPFAMADIGEALGVGSRTLIPSFNSLERQKLFVKTGRDKRNGQDVNVYTLGKTLTTS